MKRTQSTALLSIPILLLLGAAGCRAAQPISRGDHVNTSLIRSDYTPGELTRLCEAAIREAGDRFDLIAKIPADQRNVNNTLLAFEKVNADFSDQVYPLTFMGYVSTQEEISKEGSECEQLANQFAVSVNTRRDLYDSMKDLKGSSSPESRLLFETLRVFEENGLKLSEEKLKELKELKQYLAKVESEFSANLNRDQSTLEYTLAELQGVPRDFVDSLKKTQDGKYVVTTKEPHFIRLMDNAVLEATRKKMLEAYENRMASENTRLLEMAIQTRQKIAAVMGYKNWADYRTHSRMAKNSGTVLSFLGGLKEKLSQRNREDLQKLLKLKKESDPSATELKSWDIRHFAYQLKKRDLKLDDEMIREYFPAKTVLSGLFHVYSKLLGVQFVEDKGAQVWADGVKFYQIREAKDNRLIGYFYTDFIPRPGKYGHAAAFPLISARALEGHTYSYPVSAVVANFSVSENGKPVLLKHDEVRTIFHEFGHIMHQTLTRAPYASLSGSSVDQDFVEAPSQMLENWIFSPKILALLSGHYKNPQQKLPPELVQKLVEVRDFNQGYFYTRQLLFALFDMTCHTTVGPVDPTKLHKDLYHQLVGIAPVENSHFPATFGHLMGGYDAGYYGYLWSEVYAADMFTRFEKEGLLNPAVGKDYRKNILERGKMADGFDLLHAFLGRKPNTDAFYKKLHIRN